ncbi:MAG: SpoIIE family protein phosphatase [Acidobacteriota bacterium]
MKKRIWILGLLIGLAALCRLFEAHQIIVRPTRLFVTYGFQLNCVEGKLVVTSVSARESGGKPNGAFLAGLRAGDEVVGIYDSAGRGGTIAGLFDFGRITRELPPDNPVILAVERGPKTEGRAHRLQIKLPNNRPSGIGLLLLTGAGIVLPFLAILTAAFIGFLKPKDDNAFQASLLFLCFSGVFLLHSYSLPAGIRELALVLSSCLYVFLFYIFMRFFLTFPLPSLIDRKLPWLKPVGFWITLLLAGYVTSVSLAIGYSFQLFHQLTRVYSPTIVLAVIQSAMFLVGLASLTLNTLKAETLDEKRRMRILLAGTSTGLLPLFVLVGYSALFPEREVSFWAILLVVTLIGLFPLSFVYVVVKHRVLGIRVILRKGLQYVLISRAFRIAEAVVLFAILYLLFRDLLPPQVRQSGPVTIAVFSSAITVAVMMLFRRVNRPILQSIDRRFFRESYNAQLILTDLGRAVRRLAAQPDQLLQLVTDKISDSLFPDRVAIFLKGADLVPANDTQSLRQTRFLSVPQDGTYRCRWLRTRSGYEDERMWANHECEGLELPEDSFITQYLESSVNGEPATLDVYLDDPKSWANALVKASDPGSPQFRERQILERLNTRLIAPLVANDRILGFMSLGERLSEEPYSRDDKELLLTVGEQVALALDYAQLIEQVTEQQMLKRELEIAKEVQAELFPRNLPALRTLEYTGICRAARGIGGDYYDFLPLGSNRLGIALGDISGKGISAALLMANLQALLRSHAPARGDSVAELLGDINRLLCSSTDSSKYGTFFYALYDDDHRTLTYVNAGHNPPILYRPSLRTFGASGRLPAPSHSPASTALQTARSDPFLRLETGGTVIGLLPDSSYRQETVQMLSGDILLIFSDGVSEAMDENRVEFGEERLASTLAAHSSLSAKDLQSKILAEIDRFAGEAPQHDDLTLVVAKAR